MSIEIVRLKIVAKTGDGDYGVDIPFASGLFLLRVENSHGKSTCMNAIAYALGMEKALGQGGSRPPFPGSLTKALLTKDNKEIRVHSSYVLLEIKNHTGNIVTLKRTIVGASDENIISAFPCSIDVINQHQPKLLYLHREGDTTRELGFYYWFADYVGWKIPQVPNHNGGESPLYPSIIFPTWFVEQKKGWGSIQATTPTIFGIKDAKKRAIEFILSLDVNDNINKRSSLKSEIDDVLYQWKIVKRKAEISSAKVSGVVTGIPEQPDSKFDNFKIDIVRRGEEEVTSIVDLKDKLAVELSKYASLDSMMDDGVELQKSALSLISINTDKVKTLELDLQTLSDEKSYIQYQIDATKKRLSNLIDDKRKYEDLKKVADSGVFDETSILVNECPTCGANYSDNLIDLSLKDNLMTYEESLAFIKEQIKAFEFVLSDCSNQLSLKKAEQSEIESEMASLRNEILILKNHKNPAIAIQEDFLRKKINIENQINDISIAIHEITQIRLDLDVLWKKHTKLVAERKKFPSSILSTKDLLKLNYLSDGLKQRLRKYTFSSFDPGQVEVSEDSYQPTREGFDIGFEVSASDGIRIIWGYLISLFDAGKKFSTNHPRVIIFDEPRQQEANKLSFSELLKDAAQIANQGGQIIFATSEVESVLREALIGESCTIVAFDKNDGKLIRKF
ncbi:hypothetical protein [Rahnella aceris]